MARAREYAFLALVLMALPAVSFSAGPEIFLREDPELYLAIDKLQGMGLLPEIMTGDRGLDVSEVAREARKAEDAAWDPFVAGMIRFLQLDAAREFDFRLRAGLSYSGDGQIPPNAQGFPVPKGGGAQAGGFFRAAPADWLAIQARGDLAAGTDGEKTGRLEETSIRLGFPQATLEAGRFSLWWGPGRHGALIFSTNAEPLWGFRLRNPRPIPLGWWFKFLGEIQYDLFVARLEGSRPIPHSLLSGMRLAIRPNRYLEIGASRAIHFGGEGEGSGLSDYWEAFRGTRENDPGNRRNQIAGFDILVTLPFKVQPFQFYLEMAGEDQAQGIIVPLPYKWAFLSGVFLPTVFGSPRADLRVEAALNHLQGNGPAWYVHGTSGDGYAHRYRGRILGHPMGTDARDLFIEGHYFLLPSSYLEANFDLTHRYSPGPEREESRTVTAAFVAWLTRNLRAEGRLAFQNVKNENGTPGADSTDASIRLTVACQYR